MSQKAAWVIASVLAMASLNANAFRRSETSVEIDTGRHSYVIWMDPAGEDHPMTAEEQGYYCSAGQAFAKNIWDTTNGRHRIENVHFHYDYSEPVGGWDIHWRRIFDVQDSGTFYERARYCRHKWVWDNASIKLVVADDPCPEGSVCDPAGDPGREMCLRGGSTLMTDPVETGWVMTHEVSHYNYDLPDEYDSGEPGVPALFAWCENPEYKVSMMSVPAVHWCDRLTHSGGTRLVEGIPFTVPNQNDPDDNLWSQIKRGSWIDLYNYYEGDTSPDQGEYITNPAPPPSFDEGFCTFGGTAYEDGELADIIIAVDRSGSMNYEGDFAEYTAFEGAFAAGIEHYNLTGEDRKSGIITFNSEADFLVPYDVFSDYVSVDDFSDVEAGGTTNLCDAINTAADAFRNSGVTDKTGALIMLTDGLPTTSGCSQKSDVIDAALNACGEWEDGKRLAISTVAYGNADYENG